MPAKIENISEGRLRGVVNNIYATDHPLTGELLIPLVQVDQGKTFKLDDASTIANRFQELLAEKEETKGRITLGTFKRINYRQQLFVDHAKQLLTISGGDADDAILLFNNYINPILARLSAHLSALEKTTAMSETDRFFFKEILYLSYEKQKWNLEGLIKQVDEIVRALQSSPNTRAIFFRELRSGVSMEEAFQRFKTYDPVKESREKSELEQQQARTLMEVEGKKQAMTSMLTGVYKYSEYDAKQTVENLYKLFFDGLVKHVNEKKLSGGSTKVQPYQDTIARMERIFGIVDEKLLLIKQKDPNYNAHELHKLLMELVEQHDFLYKYSTESFTDSVSERAFLKTSSIIVKGILVAIAPFVSTKATKREVTTQTDSMPTPPAVYQDPAVFENIPQGPVMPPVNPLGTGIPPSALPMGHHPVYGGVPPVYQNQPMPAVAPTHPAGQQGTTQFFKQQVQQPQPFKSEVELMKAALLARVGAYREQVTNHLSNEAYNRHVLRQDRVTPDDMFEDLPCIQYALENEGSAKSLLIAFKELCEEGWDPTLPSHDARKDFGTHWINMTMNFEKIAKHVAKSALGGLFKSDDSVSFPNPVKTLDAWDSDHLKLSQVLIYFALRPSESSEKIEKLGFGQYDEKYGQQNRRGRYETIAKAYFQHSGSAKVTKTLGKTALLSATKTFEDLEKQVISDAESETITHAAGNCQNPLVSFAKICPERPRSGNAPQA